MLPKFAPLFCGAAIAAACAMPAAAQTYRNQEGPVYREGPPMGAPGSPRGPEAPRSYGDTSTSCEAMADRVQQTICKNSDLIQLDRDVHRFDQGPGGADNAAWRQRLESCVEAAPTGYDGPIYNCLRRRYEARLVQLSRRAGNPQSGEYHLMSGAISGKMTLVGWPDHTTLIFDKVTADGARACGIRMDVPQTGGRIAGSPDGLPGCRVSVSIDGATANVFSNGCRSVCEMGRRVDGTYILTGRMSPAARPTR
jgi:hypothetical protein